MLCSCDSMVLTNFTSFYLPCLAICLAQCLNRFLNVNVLIGAFNQEKVMSQQGLLCDCKIFADLRFQLYLLLTSHTQAGEMICHPGRIDPDRDMIWDEQGIERGVHIQVCADRNSLGLVHTADPNNQIYPIETQAILHTPQIG